MSNANPPAVAATRESGWVEEVIVRLQETGLTRLEARKEFNRRWREFKKALETAEKKPERPVRDAPNTWIRRAGLFPPPPKPEAIAANNAAWVRARQTVNPVSSDETDSREK